MGHDTGREGQIDGLIGKMEDFAKNYQPTGVVVIGTVDGMR